MKFKVIDTQTGEVCAKTYKMFLGHDGKLYRYNGVSLLPLDPNRYQVRMSTGISDKNGRELFDGEYFQEAGNTYKIERNSARARFDARDVVSGSVFTNWYLFPEDIEYIEEDET